MATRKTLIKQKSTIWSQAEPGGKASDVKCCEEREEISLSVNLDILQAELLELQSEVERLTTTLEPILPDNSSDAAKKALEGTLRDTSDSAVVNKIKTIISIAQQTRRELEDLRDTVQI